MSSKYDQTHRFILHQILKSMSHLQTGYELEIAASALANVNRIYESLKKEEQRFLTEGVGMVSKDLSERAET